MEKQESPSSFAEKLALEILRYEPEAQNEILLDIRKRLLDDRSMKIKELENNIGRLIKAIESLGGHDAIPVEESRISRY